MTGESDSFALDASAQAHERASILADISALLAQVFALEHWGRLLVEVARNPAGEIVVSDVAVEQVTDEARVDAAFGGTEARVVVPALARAAEALSLLDGVDVEELGGGTFVRIADEDGAVGDPRVEFLPGLVRTPSADFELARDGALHYAREIVASLRERFGLGANTGIELKADMLKGTVDIVDGAKVLATAWQVVIGSFSRRHRSWVWGAHNPTLEAAARRRSAEILDAMPERSAWEISTPGFVTDEPTAWALAAWLAKHAGLSLSRIEAGEGFVVLGLRDIQTG